MKPLHDVREDEGPFRAPLACLNHLFPFHLARRPLRRPGPAGEGLSWSPREAALLDLAAALLEEDRPRAEAALGRLGSDYDARELVGSWWIGLAAFVQARAEALDLGPSLPEPARRLLAASALAARARAAAIEPAVRDTLALLERGGVAAVVLKGLAHAWLWYPEPWARPIGDLDLLVPRDAAPRARALLLAEGLRPGREETGPEHHHEPPLWTEVGGHPLVVELHTRVAAEATAEFTQRAFEAREESAGLPVLAAADRVAHLALHHTGELDCKSLLDLAAAYRHEGTAGFRAARARLPARTAWRLDLAAGLVEGFLGARPGATPTDAIPPARRRAIARAAVGNWGRAHAVWMCRAGGRERPRHWLEPWRPRVDEVVRAPRAFGRAACTARAAVLWAWRQARVLARVATDVWGFIWPPPAALGRARRADRAYAANVLRSARSVASRLVEGLRGGPPQAP